MRRLVASHQRVWLSLDRSFTLELSFLHSKAEPLAIQNIHQSILDALPTEQCQKSIAATLLVLHQVKTSSLCLACGPSVVAEVDGVHSMVNSIDEGVGVEPRDLANFTEFYKAVVARLQYFFVREQAAPVSVGKKVLVGRAALLDLYESIAATKKGGGDVPMKDLQPLRAFKWLLSSEQLSLSANWIQDATVSHAAMLARNAIGDGAPVDGTGACGSTEGSIVATTATLLNAPTAAPKKKSKGSEESVGGASKKDLMHFFVGKSK